VTLGTSREVDSGKPPAFDGHLKTPDRMIVISTVEGKTILKDSVPGIITRVRVWVNHPSMPDEVIIGFD
jgi:hypothetical protein